MSIKSGIRGAGALFLLLVLSVAGGAQGTSSLRGTVTDAQKGAIVNVKVTLIGKENGLTRTVITQQTGEYQFPQVQPGLYTLTAESAGFAVAKIEDIHLLVDTPATIDVMLQVASNTSTVSVSEETPQINTVNASVGVPFQEKQIQSLPLQTRNIVELLSLQPGVTPTGEVMGARRDQNNVTLDGVDANDNQNALSGLNGTATNEGFNSALPIPLDSVMEFRVTVAGPEAIQGRSSGGQVSLITRSGTNSFHGSAYEFNRNTDFTANSFFNNLNGVPRAQLVRNQFGASLGGPIKKDRLFFFLNYERRIDSSETAVTQAVPSETLKQGIVKVQLADGSVQTLSPSDVAAIDPLHIGVNSKMLNYLNQYPVGNDPSYGADGGLNFTGLLFNAPNKLDSRVYVGKFDWIIDPQAKHTISFRGTLSNDGQTNVPAQLPGQQAASNLLADNRGFSVRYTGILTPTIVNTATVGLTRVGLSTTGTAGTGFKPGDSLSSFYDYNSTDRPTARINPTWNFTDDLTWTKGKHTITTGINLRFMNNNPVSYANSWPVYNYSQGLLVGLGNDIQNDVAGYLGTTSANLANTSAVTNAFGNVLGLVNGVGVTYYYGKNGQALPIGQAFNNTFITRTYEPYVQDSWKVSKSLTLTFGLRYQYDTPPYEANGLQVNSTPGINQYFANRVYAADNGIPGNQLPNNDMLTYALGGPVNGKPSWFKPDTNNFAPRFSFAWSPDSKTVVRGGYALVYDQYGNDLVTNYSALGSAGLATSLGFADSYNFTTSPRYNGTYPALPTAPTGGFPFTPPLISAIAGTLYGISPDLVDPYSHLFNFTVSHEFASRFGLDLSYVGRLSHKLLLQQDMFTPLIYFKDPKSGITWAQNDDQMRQMFNNGLTPAQVQANPSLVPRSPFVEDMFPSYANYWIPGSASANYYYAIYNVFGGSDLDNLHYLDRRFASTNSCFTITGCYTFFAPQGSADPTWTNSGNAAYHALTVTLRRTVSNGVSFDFNYTWSHSIDNASTAADGAGQFGGVLQNAFLPGQDRNSSDFDIRHLINANVLYELPVGKGKRFFNSVPGWADAIIGGWRVASLIRIQSGLPQIITGTDAWVTNYWINAVAIPNGPSPKTGVFTDENGIPNLFQTVNAVNDYQNAFPGGSGLRAIVRMPWNKNVDLSVAKDFHLPWENQTLSFRAEAFNAFNFVNFTYQNILNPNTGISNLSLLQTTTFGEFNATADPRVLQLALRYSF